MKYVKLQLNNGYVNRILALDLGTGTIEAPELDPKVRDYFIGGRGLGLYLLHKKIAPGMSAYDPKTPLILSPGPLGGVPQFPGTSKCMAVSLSPITGIPGVSNFGGHFGAYLKYAGFDAPSLRTILQAQLPTPAPTPTPAPVVGKPTFDANIQPLLVPCAACHNGTAPSANLDLSSFASVMKGGKDGVIVMPGNSAGSLLVKIQSSTHFRNLTPEQLVLVEQWIDAGALEK